MMLKLRHIFLSLMLMVCLSPYAQSKREFRGAWIQCVNGQFMGIGTKKMQETLTYQLDELKKDGVNAIIFQVRPECDALYQSSIEPWSRFLTGKQGVAPSPFWDPLEWMIRECHRRGMELHAWINPFRAKTKTTHELADNNICMVQPSAYFEYDGLFILDPASQRNRDYICMVSADIVRRYDVDGFHIDDYFYPYPAAGVVIPDKDLYESNPMGFRSIGDWRRNNVNLFIKQLSDTLHSIKPWVKFGVSPFGIYRNVKSDPSIGSATNGLENYDGLYADVLLWINNGWIDYCVPQIYWEIGNKAADYETLIRWWNKFAGKRPLYIGEDIERTVKFADVKNSKAHQMSAKFRLHQDMKNVKGTVLWYAKAAVDNVGNYGSELRNVYWRYPALHPLMPFKGDVVAPGKVRGVRAVWTMDGYTLFWDAPKKNKNATWKDDVRKYVVYRFDKNERIDLNDASHIVEVTYNTWHNMKYTDGKVKYVYVVTAVDRMENEGVMVKKVVKL